MTDSISQRAAEQAELGAERLDQLAQVAKQAAERGGAELMRHYGRIASVQSKGRAGDLVTNADLAAEEFGAAGPSFADEVQDVRDWRATLP